MVVSAQANHHLIPAGVALPTRNISGAAPADGSEGHTGNTGGCAQELPGVSVPRDIVVTCRNMHTASHTACRERRRKMLAAAGIRAATVPVEPCQANVVAERRPARRLGVGWVSLHLPSRAGDTQIGCVAATE